jgi:hypothetical protein
MAAFRCVRQSCAGRGRRVDDGTRRAYPGAMKSTPRTRKTRTPRTQTPRGDLRDLLAPYTSFEWVAIPYGHLTVVGAGMNLQDAHDDACKHGYRETILMKIYPSDRVAITRMRNRVRTEGTANH